MMRDKPLRPFARFVFAFVAVNALIGATFTFMLLFPNKRTRFSFGN